ncbi:scavenger receptor cysteine-rich type 1 protein M130-like [Actinia tenebrosa]|uniref:Scavenger receptor cysteine-rich type 1 protein M130-like n=1 Tax=Actinia tenebrosa TaxID=6105 RepID=A0A6P8I824_ACTTE|nr:scavenger receptor cysteine-rich type 1 protein M130-like [Actinia tenebrosa]
MIVSKSPETNGTLITGEVLLSLNGVKAPIGINNWDKNAMDVVCRMLGIEGPHDASPLTKWSGSDKHIWVDHTKCLGNESSLLDCDHPGLRNKNQYIVTSSTTAVVACGQQKRCGSSLKIPNGNVKCINDTCHVTCHLGYFIMGSRVVTCIQGKPLADSIPKCRD